MNDTPDTPSIEPGTLGFSLTVMEKNMAFFKAMTGDGVTIVALPMDEARWAGLRKMLFTTAIIAGKIGDERFIDDRWCYSSADDALIGLINWGKAGWTGEPKGWIKHPMSGRRWDPKTGIAFDPRGSAGAG